METSQQNLATHHVPCLGLKGVNQRNVYRGGGRGAVGVLDFLIIQSRVVTIVLGADQLIYCSPLYTVGAMANETSVI